MQVFLGSGLGPSDRPGMTFLGKNNSFQTLLREGRLFLPQDEEFRQAINETPDAEGRPWRVSKHARRRNAAGVSGLLPIPPRASSAEFAGRVSVAASDPKATSTAPAARRDHWTGRPQGRL
jgi:hypothetical protein